MLTPFIVFIILCIFLIKGLFSNPKEIGSGRVGQTMPAFMLPDLMDSNQLRTNKDLLGEVYLINVWGTWCPTCLIELPYLTKLRQQGIKIIGLYYEQSYDADFSEAFDIAALRQEVSGMLMRTGDPYQFNILDLERTLSLDLGVSGAPEHFLVDQNGLILVHHTGDINERVWRAKFASQLAGLNP
jgi:cytochrome c biogenesis protein CcmG/thiol:disulfide interchange protein DsbE